MHYISELIIKHLRQEITPEERLKLDNWLNESVENSNLFYSLCDEYTNREYLSAYAEDKEKVKKKIMERIPELALIQRKKTQRRTAFLVASMMAAAAIFYFVFFFPSTPRVDTSLAKRMIPTSEEKRASLILSNQTVIPLDSIAPGSIIQDGPVKISKEKSGLLRYAIRKRSAVNSLTNIIKTPAAGKYQVILPDSSVVWLNAASSLQFPVAFDSHKRNVTLSGEGYFEVAKDKTRPFLVTVSGVQVEVLGTHFNINAYKDEDALKTTLLEGAVKVISLGDNTGKSTGKAVLLKPGQQLSMSHDGGLSLSTPNIAETISWITDNVYFDLEGIKPIMRQVARYYDVQVIFEGPVSKDKFSTPLDTKQPLSFFLDLLELTKKVKFRVEGKKVFVKSVQ